ncbi:hypothetical protein Pcinc_008483 [Petrolisthes cinctipes]|uniref:Uncharacterized protein n=1 Tax=Petrolisthes cinctipes TaxID=88211 RepID=A0AAE1KZD1_PETCI|nr:hypothetical protein Pcinc_008483 [Petrolisthes cinctipes]
MGLQEGGMVVVGLEAGGVAAGWRGSLGDVKAAAAACPAPPLLPAAPKSTLVPPPSVFLSAGGGAVAPASPSNGSTFPRT